MTSVAARMSALWRIPPEKLWDRIAVGDNRRAHHPQRRIGDATHWRSLSLIPWSCASAERDMPDNGEPRHRCVLLEYDAEAGFRDRPPSTGCPSPARGSPRSRRRARHELEQCRTCRSRTARPPLRTRPSPPPPQSRSSGPQRTHADQSRPGRWKFLTTLRSLAMRPGRVPAPHLDCSDFPDHDDKLLHLCTILSVHRPHLRATTGCLGSSFDSRGLRFAFFAGFGLLMGNFGWPPGKTVVNGVLIG